MLAAVIGFGKMGLGLSNVEALDWNFNLQNFSLTYIHTHTYTHTYIHTYIHKCTIT